MFCPKCGKELPVGAAFCGACGNPAPKPIPQINTPTETPAPVQQNTPAQEAPAPVQQNTPVQETPAPAQQTQPVQETPASVQQNTPVQETPAPVQQNTPVQEAPAPVQQNTPVQETPAPVQQNTPAQEAPAPAQQTQPVAESEGQPAVCSEQAEASICPNCKTPTETGATACPACGAPLKKTKKKSKKPLVIIIIVLIVIAIGGGTAWYFLLGGDRLIFGEPESTTTAEPQISDAEESVSEETTPEVTEATLAEPDFDPAGLYGVWTANGDESRVIALTKQGAFLEIHKDSFRYGTFVPTENMVILTHSDGTTENCPVSFADGFTLILDGEEVLLEREETFEENTNTLLGVWYCRLNDEAVVFADDGRMWASNGTAGEYFFNAFDLTLTIAGSGPIACRPEESALGIDFEGNGTYFEYIRIK